jgi:hypothetical protein
MIADGAHASARQVADQIRSCEDDGGFLHEHLVAILEAFKQAVERETRQEIRMSALAVAHMIDVLGYRLEISADGSERLYRPDGTLAVTAIRGGGA